MVITWQFRSGVGTLHNTWQGGSIAIAAARFQRYWNVTFKQVKINPNVIVQTRRNGANGEAMAQAGNRIWVNADFKWGKSEAARQQMALTVCHEIGHWLVQGNGKDGHLPAGNVMAAVIGDPWLNWTQADMRWFARLPWKSSLRPWHEPDFWRPKTMMAEQCAAVRVC